MTDSIVDGTNIDTSLFAFSQIKPHASGGRVVNLLNKNTKESLTISTPLILTWGAQEGLNDKKERNGKWAMALQFPTPEYSTPDLDAFLSSMRALDKKVKEVAMKNSIEWFGEEEEITAMPVIEKMFNPMLKHPKKEKGGTAIDKSRPPSMTVKIPQWSGVWKPEIYDEDGEPLFVNGKVGTHLSPLEFLKPRSHIICLLQCGGLWFVNGKVSITWNLKQAIVQKPKNAVVEGTCFLRPKAEDKQFMKSLPPPEDVDPEGAPTTIVEDSDDEREYPAPTPVKEEPVVAKEEPVVAKEEPVVAKEATIVKEEPVVKEEPTVAKEDAPAKKKIVRKKNDA